MPRGRITYKGAKQGLRKRGKVYGKAGYQLYRDLQYVKSLVNSELHYVAIKHVHTIDSAGAIYHLSPIPQDDTNYGRSGNSVLPRYLNLIFSIYNRSTTTTPGQIDQIRLMIFRWKDNSTPNISTLFEDPTFPVYSPLNDNISGNKADTQINIIMNKNINLVYQSAAAQVKVKKNIDLNPPDKMTKDHIKFNNVSTVDPLGGIYMLLVGSYPNVSSQTVIDGYTKLSFHDN